MVHRYGINNFEEKTTTMSPLPPNNGEKHFEENTTNISPLPTNNGVKHDKLTFLLLHKQHQFIINILRRTSNF